MTSEDITHFERKLVLQLLQFCVKSDILCFGLGSFRAVQGDELVGDFLDGSFILASILLNATLGFIQEFRAEKALEKLKSYAVAKTRVLRDGKELEVPSNELVRGDIVILSEGDRIPADGTLLKNHHLEVDESVLTGESLPVIKQEKDTLSLGTLVTKGKGTFEVTLTGNKTQFGQIAKSLSTIENEKTPLQIQLATLGKVLSLIAIVAASLLIPIGLFYNQEPFHLILIAVSVGVLVIPEGLPAVITIALAVGTNRMARRSAIVKKMQAVETLGEVQVIIVDKTGTLTHNTMRVKKHYLHKEKNLSPLLSACILGNTASLVPTAHPGTVDILGDKTDGALLLWATQLQPEIPVSLGEGKIVDEYVFESTTKTITTTWEYKGKVHVFVRGAPEVLIQKSNLTEKEKEEEEKHYESLAKEGLRVIAFGSKIESHKGDLSREHVEQHLEFLGLVGIADPARAEVKEALHLARKAGIRTIMVTGDNELTALAIGKEIGLIEGYEDVMTGQELETASDEEVLSLLPNTSIFARATPHDKLRIATLLQKQGYVVGVTGDGVNDALALKKADVGVAMGHSGTDVAKEAADIVLVNDNFATLINAVEEGRVIYSNILKAITYLLTSNFSNLILVVASVALNLPTVLLPTQILWINIITDSLPALSLATDPKSPNVLNHPPRDHTAPILTRQRLLRILSVGSIIATILLTLYLFLLSRTDHLVARTIIFNCLIFTHLLVAFLIRGKAMFHINPMLIAAIILTIILQTIITFTPFFQTIFHLAH